MTTTTSTIDTPRLAWLTLERLAYALLVLIPTAIRLVDLGGRTLAPVEASTALRAWQTSQGLHPLLDAGSPLLFSLQSLTFFLMGATNALARAWPLLAAAAIPIVLYFAREWLGRATTLLAAALISISPLINAFARRGDGVSFALLAAAIVLAGWARLQTKRSHGWTLTLSGIALALLSGPAGFTVLIALAIILPLTLPQELTPPVANDWALAALILFAGGAAFFTRFDAMGLAAINLTQWLTDFSWQGLALLLGAIRMAADEPLLSLFGFAALLWGIRRPGKLRAFSIAAAVTVIIAILQGPDQAYSRAVAAFFLAIPTAALLVRLAHRGDLSFHSLEQILFVASQILLAFLAVFALTSFAFSGDFSRLSLFFITLLMGLFLSGVFIWFIGRAQVRGGLLITALILTLLFGSAMLWSLAFNHTLPTLARISPTEPLPDAQYLVRTYGDISERLTGDRWAQALVLIPGSQADDVVQWQLRRAEALTRADSISDQQAPPIVIAPSDANLALGDGYAGQRFALLSSWGIDHLASTNDAIRWFFFRRAPFPPPTTDTIDFWVRLDLLDLNQQP